MKNAKHALKSVLAPTPLTSTLLPIVKLISIQLTFRYSKCILLLFLRGRYKVSFLTVSWQIHFSSSWYIIHFNFVGHIVKLFSTNIPSPKGIPRLLSGQESACQCRRWGFYPWVRKISWRRKWQPTPVSLPGKSHGQRSLAGHSPWSCKRVRHDLVTKQQQRHRPSTKWGEGSLGKKGELNEIHKHRRG